MRFHYLLRASCYYLDLSRYCDFPRPSNRKMHAAFRFPTSMPPDQTGKTTQITPAQLPNTLRIEIMRIFFSRRYA